MQKTMLSVNVERGRSAGHPHQLIRGPLFTLRSDLRTGVLLIAALLIALGWSGLSSAQTHGNAFSSLVNTVQGARTGTGGDKTGGGTTPTDATDYFIQYVDPVVQSNCVACHRPGLVAEQQGARLLFGNDATANEQAVYEFVSRDGVGADWLLNKIAGDLNHGGGAVLSRGGDDYNKFAEYLTLATGANTGGGDVGIANLWAGTQLEPRETTLRRAGILLSGTLPSAEMINRAKVSDEALRAEVLRLMVGDGFHDFLINGANDQLLTDGLNNGIDFQFGFWDRFPGFSAYASELPEERPEEFNDYHDKPFLAQNEAEWDFRWAVVREPLELIADIIESGQSYKKILTADYTMVNPMSAFAYRADVDFGIEFPDAQGFYDRSKLNVFKRARNLGHIPYDDEFNFDWETRTHLSFSDYQEWPHAGVLSTPAWLGRYPSTDTNRNRARARWTYYHFLGVDIEKSAPRTTDPDALADTDNPTLKNPACTVCHERMDPVAGTYQSFGDQGSYLDQHGGKDSLPESYKYPEWHGGEPGSTGYQEGDTWYRDMRAPGFEGTKASGTQDSLQWLGQQIVNDPRFSAQAVRFWWPAIFGERAATPPENPDLPDYDARLMAFNAQEALVGELAEKFEASAFRAKQLFADMILSPWFRTSAVDDSTLTAVQRVALESVGSGRLLTPEEIDRKNRAVFGRTWGQQAMGNAHDYEPSSNFNRGWGGYSTFYGGIDGATVTTRNRNMTALMSNVVEKMALDLSCQVVLEEFSYPPEERHLFKWVEKTTHPLQLANAQFDLEKDPAVNQETPEFYERELAFTSGDGELVVRISDVSPNGCVRDDERSTDDRWEGWCSHIGLERIDLVKEGRVVKSLQGAEIENFAGFANEQWYDEETGDSGDRGWTNTVDGRTFWAAHTNAWFSLEFDVPPGSYEVQLTLVSWFNEGHPESAVSTDIAVSSLKFDPESEGALQVSQQLQELYRRGTTRAISPDTQASTLDAMIDLAQESSSSNSWFQGHCDTWAIWNNNDYQENDWHELMNRVNQDPSGMMVAWTMTINALLTSYLYLHD